MKCNFKVVLSVGIPTVLVLCGMLSRSGGDSIQDQVRVHQSRAVPGTAVSADIEGAHPRAAPTVETGFLAKIKTTVRQWIDRKEEPSSGETNREVAGTSPAASSSADRSAAIPRATEAPSRQPASVPSQEKPFVAQSKPESPVNTGSKAISETVQSQPLVLIQPMPEPYRYRENLGRKPQPEVPASLSLPKAPTKRAEVAPPPGFFARVRSAFTRLLNSEPAPLPKVAVKSAEEILAATSRGGFEAKDEAVKPAALELDAEEQKAQELADSAEMRHRKKLEGGLGTVDVESSVQKVLSQLKRRFPRNGEMLEKYVRINLGEDELASDYDLLQEYYVDRFNEDVAGTQAVLRAGLKASVDDDELIRLRIALFTLSTELSAVDKEIGKYAWGELQALKAAGEPQDVKATVAAYAAYVRTVSPTNKAAKRALAEYIDDLKERDPVAGAVLQKRRSLAGYR